MVNTNWVGSLSFPRKEELKNHSLADYLFSYLASLSPLQSKSLESQPIYNWKKKKRNWEKKTDNGSYKPAVMPFKLQKFNTVWLPRNLRAVECVIPQYNSEHQHWGWLVNWSFRLYFSSYSVWLLAKKQQQKSWN